MRVPSHHPCHNDALDMTSLLALPALNDIQQDAGEGWAARRFALLHCHALGRKVAPGPAAPVCRPSPLFTVARVHCICGKETRAGLSAAPAPHQMPLAPMHLP